MRTQANDNKPVKPQPIKYENLPTKERLAKGEFEIYDSGRGRNVPTAKATALLLIDKLRIPRTKTSEPVLNEFQHNAGVVITDLYERTYPNTTATAKMSDIRVSGCTELAAIDAITASHRYNMTLKLMCAYQYAYWQLVAAICFDPIPTMTKACMKAGFRDTHTHTQHVRNAFDLLDDCLQEMRTRLDYLKKTFE